MMKRKEATAALGEIGKQILWTLLLGLLTMFFCLYIADDVLGLNQPPAKAWRMYLGWGIHWVFLIGLPILLHKRIAWYYTLLNLPLYYLLFLLADAVCGLRHHHWFLSSSGFFSFGAGIAGAFVTIRFWMLQSLTFGGCCLFDFLKKRLKK